MKRGGQMKRKQNISKRKAQIGLLFILPWLIGFLVFILWPLIQSFYFSLNTIRIRPTGRVFRFDGFLNYKDVWLKDMFFIQQLLLFLISSLFKVPIIVVFSLIIALLLNTKIRFKGIFRSIFFLPVVIASGPVLQQLMNQGATSIPILDTVSIGNILNKLLPIFLVTPILELFSQIIIILWNSGVQILIFIASLQKIDKSLYEAAKIDGGSVWVCFWKITLPTLKPMIFLNAMYTLITLSNSNDNNIINLIYMNMFSATRGYGFASAMAWMYAVIVFSMVGVIYLLFKTKVNK
ncbi:sugar ABC transporter permease [Aerococcaceae bacterium zg-BR9]|uniref:carbohydrate ABC transporter permease n=1 Tax=Aerococcaceae bacterium zg-1292 TaxID=2774330 RepID=UPI0040635F42|nr:sugar ABC transporter permease [Aerococcaceae bacterium zg-BR9]